MKRPVLLCIGLLLLVACVPFPHSRFDLYQGNPSAVTRLIMISGVNGETHATTEPENIAAFFELVNSLTFTPCLNQAPRGGYLYRVELYEGGEKTLEVTFENRAATMKGIGFELDSDVRAALDELFARIPQQVAFYRLRFELTTDAKGARVTAQDASNFLTARLMGATGDPLKRGVTLNSVWVAPKENGDGAGVTADFAVAWRGELVEPVAWRFEQMGEGTSVLRVYNVGKESVKLLDEISYAGGEPFAFSLNLSSLESLSRLEGEIPVRPGRMLWAYYYPWYGANDWDTSILQDAPAMGYYGSDNPAVIKRHIEQAQGAGIDGFISSWWGPGDYTDRNLGALLDAAEEADFSVMINFELLDYDGKARPETEVLEWLRYAVSTYGNHPNYMKVDGRPVLVIWASGSMPNDAWEHVLSQLRAEGLDPFLLGQFGGEWARLDDLGLFDGLYQYSILNVMSSGEQVQTLFDVYESTGRAAHYYPLLMDSPTPRIWAATVQPGYDDHLIPGRQTPILGRDGGRLYRATFEAALRSDPDWLFISTWNEWWEHSYIEPSRDFGDLYLRITREYSERWK